VPSLLQRLKERKIVQWAIVYLAGAWLVLEALGFVADNFGWPTYITRSAIVLAAVGFFAVLVLAWYHGEKGRQRASGVELLILAGILVIAAAGVATFGRAGGDVEKRVAETDVSAATIDAKSVAVLPFANLGGDPDKEYFSDGITGEIINHLAKIADLKVISRTSVMQYKDTDKNLRLIGDELGVAAIVEGEVLQIGDRVRVNAQLIDANTDVHLWADQYDRQLTDVFAVQSDMAQQIAAALQATLTPTVKEEIERRPTDKLEAYGYYLRAMDYRGRSETDEDTRSAIQMVQAALELDAEFAEAWALLSRLHSRFYWFYWDRSDERLALARSAVQKALELQPGMGEAHVALGYYYYWGFLDYDRALAEFDLALQNLPNDAQLWAGIGLVKRRQGKFEEAISHFRKAFQLNPRSAQLAFTLADTYLYALPNFAEAERYCDRTILLNPDWSGGYIYKARLYVYWQGDVEKAREVLDAWRERSDSIYRDYTIELIYGRRYAEALEWLSSYPSEVIIGSGGQTFTPKALRYAQVYTHLDRREQALAYYDSARVFLEAELVDRPDDERLHSALGIAYAGLGRKEDAIREGKLGVELTPLEKDAWGKGPTRLEDMTQIYILAGEHDAAIDELEHLLSIASEVSVPLLRIDPAYDPVRDHPRFQALLAK
jgi:serine/threonine-protein kinase